MKELCDLALDTAKNRGATYTDIRIINLKKEDIYVRNGKVSVFEQSETLGSLGSASLWKRRTVSIC